MLTFDDPAYLALIALFPLLVSFLYLRKNRGGGIPYSYRVWNGKNTLYTPLSLNIAYFATEIALWIALVLLVVALAGPSLASNRKVYLERGMDIMIVLDQSPSMAARDFGAEDRLTTAREMVKDFISTRENDSIGLVSFSEEAQLRLPPTVDHDLLFSTLDDIAIMDRGDGTAIGMGLALAVLHLSSSTAGEKAILLITDGDNNVGEIQPATAASMAAQTGIRIYTIGLGTTGDVPIEFLDRESGKILSGTMKSVYDGTLLKRIAEISGGDYFYARSSGSLETILQTINTLESYEVRTKITVVKNSFHNQLILIALALFFAHWLVRRVLLGEIL